MGYEYDEAVLKCFLKQQDRLFPEPVAEGMEEAGSLPGGLHGGCCGFQSCGDGVF